MTTGRQTTADSYRTLALVLFFGLLAPASGPQTLLAAEQVVTDEAGGSAEVDAAKARFAQAQQDLKRLIAELSALQAEYQQPGADRVAIEAKFRAARDEARTAANMLKAIAHPMRLAILKFLDQGKKLTVTEIHNLLNIEQSTTSHHLGILKDKGVLSSQRDGKNTYYFLKHENLTRIIECVSQCV